jgi:hypothetical protein
VCGRLHHIPERCFDNSTTKLPCAVFLRQVELGLLLHDALHPGAAVAQGARGVARAEWEAPAPSEDLMEVRVPWGRGVGWLIASLAASTLSCGVWPTLGTTCSQSLIVQPSIGCDWGQKEVSILKEGAAGRKGVVGGMTEHLV